MSSRRASPSPAKSSLHKTGRAKVLPARADRSCSCRSRRCPIEGGPPSRSPAASASDPVSLTRMNVPGPLRACRRGQDSDLAHRPRRTFVSCAAWPSNAAGAELSQLQDGEARSPERRRLGRAEGAARNAGTVRAGHRSPDNAAYGNGSKGAPDGRAREGIRP
jgi:hypothetical protein